MDQRESQIACLSNLVEDKVEQHAHKDKPDDNDDYVTPRYDKN